jgi:hypothetical protein
VKKLGFDRRMINTPFKIERIEFQLEAFQFPKWESEGDLWKIPKIKPHTPMTTAEMENCDPGRGI